MNAGSMASGWYYSKRGASAGQQVGPLTWEQLYSLARSGSLAGDDLVWNPGLPEWLPAAQIAGLFPPVAGSAAMSAQPMAPLPTSAQPGRPRRSWLLPVLIPVIAIVLVGGGLGSYFAFWSGGGTTKGGTTITTSPGALATSTTAGKTADIGAIELTLPDATKLVKTSKYGEVPVNEIGVILADGKTRADADQIAQTLGGTVVGQFDFLNLYQIQTAAATEADLQAVLDKAAALAGVQLAFPNQEVAMQDEIWGVRQSPLNDPAYSGNYGKGYELIGAQKAWNYIKGSGLTLSGVKVGIVDDGLYKDQGEFSGPANIETPDPAAGLLATPEKMKNASGGTVDNPGGSHGTEIAGIIGGDPNNGGQTGIASTALGKNLTMSVVNMYGGKYGTVLTKADPNDPTQIVQADGKSYSVGALAAMLKQVQNNAKVINCSFGADHPDPNNAVMAAAYTKFFEKMAKDHPDVTFVCAAGNEKGALTKTNYYPAGAGSGLPNVITVGNVNNDGESATSSNFAGPDGEVTLAAPGHEAVRGIDANGNPITDQTSIGGYSYGGGTSMATPQVAAAAALLISIKPDLTAAQIKEILSKTSQANRPGPENMGGGILAIDEAVLQVINQVRGEQTPKLPELTKEQLDNMGVIDAVATTTDQPNVYSVKGILASVPDNGTQVTITSTGDVTIDGDATQSVAAAGNVEWPAVTVKLASTEGGDAGAPTITVTRKDSGAASVISFEQLDLNGTWTGILTVTDFNIDQSTATSAAGGSDSEGLEGCNMAAIAAAFEKLKNQPIPMTMDITADTASGKGTAVMSLDMSSLQAQLNEGTDEGDQGSTTVSNEPQTIPFTLSGDTLTFNPDAQTGVTQSMTGTVKAQGKSAVIDGTMTAAGTGYSMKAVWTVTQQ